MYNYRLRFTKGPNLKFLSHLDLIRAIERGIRRAELPMAYSEGFHPHPKLNFGPALAVGITSNSEYFDLQLLREYQPPEIKVLLNKAFPEGLQILEAQAIDIRQKPLNAVINRAAYTVLFEGDSINRQTAVEWLNNLLRLTEIEVIRKNKEGEKLVNIRPWLHNLTTELIGTDKIMLKLNGEIGSGGNLRPEDILAKLPVPVKILEITRTDMWREEDGNRIALMDSEQRPEDL